VRGLTASDFTIFEDGRPRPVVAFVPVELAEPETTSNAAAWVRDLASDVATNRVRPEGRLVVIMFDWSIRLEDQMLAQRIARAASISWAQTIWRRWCSPARSAMPARRKISPPIEADYWRPSISRSPSHCTIRRWVPDTIRVTAMTR
jgi:hypothetical protein